MTAWKVYLNCIHIDTVFFDDTCDKEYVQKSLIDHDGYDPRIVIIKS